MNEDFNQPQRQSIVGIVVMFMYSLQGFAKAFWPVLVISIIKFNDFEKLNIIIGIVSVTTVLIGVGVISYLKYLNFTFYIDVTNNEFIITEGILNKTKTAIQLDKIQQVNINQSLIQRLVGVYELAVDTAGSNKKEADIKAISHNLALGLKVCLLTNEKHVLINNASLADDALTEKNVNQEAPFIKISFLSLLKIGITSNYVKSFFIILAFFISVFDHIKQITGRDVLEDQKIEDYVDTSQITTVALILFIIFFLTVLVVNLVRTIFKYFDYKIAKQKGSLLLSYGLLNTKSTILKPEKVQITSVTQNFFQKKMNVLGLKITQATGGGKEDHKQAIEIPGCNDIEKEAILKLLFQKIPEKGIRLKPNFRKLVFSVFLTIGLPLSAYYFIRNIVLEQIPMVDFLVLFYVLFIGMIQFFLFKNNRIYINDDFIILQSGAWDITNKIILPHKIQAITTSQLFWHKNINIGSLTLHTAGGNISFQLGNFTAIKQYINVWLYRIETSDSNWM